MSYHYNMPKRFPDQSGRVALQCISPIPFFSFRKNSNKSCKGILNIFHITFTVMETQIMMIKDRSKHCPKNEIFH